MRDSTPTIDTALQQTSFVFLFRASVEPSYIYIENTDDHFLSDFATVGGGTDFYKPLPEDFCVSPTSGSGVCWYNKDGVLKYGIQGDSTPVITTSSLAGKPGVFGSYLFLGESGKAIRRKTVNWSQVAAKNTNPFSATDNLGSTAGVPVAVHAVSDTRSVVVYDDDGGLRLSIFTTSGSEAISPGRLMYPTAIDYTPYTSGSLSMEVIATFTAACQLGDEVFIYSSNPCDGSVDGISYNTATHLWSDPFIAVPTNLQSSLCDFRICNAYVLGGKVYLIGQFRRTEVIGVNNTYNMILSSTDGVSFSTDPFTLVSSLGYRFFGCVANGMLNVGSANRVGSASLTYVFAGSSGAGLSLSIPMSDFISFRETEANQAELILRAGNDYYATHPYMREGSRVKLDLGYQTSSGSEYIQCATYIINGVGDATAQGDRGFSIGLVNYSEWLLSGLNSPFYTEFFSKSSVYDDMSEDSGNMYPATDMYDMRTGFVIDFWNSEEWECAAEGITGVNLISKGGVTHIDEAAAHYFGVKCRDLETALNLREAPKVTGTITAKVYGWSHANSGANNDYISLVVFYRQQSSGSDLFYMTDPLRWDNFYPASEVHDGNPLNFSIPTSGSAIDVDDEILGLGLTIEGTNTDFCPARIEITGGVKCKFAFLDSNTRWKSVQEGGKLPGTIRPYIMFSQKPFDAWNFFQVAEFRDDIEDSTIVDGYACGGGLIGLAMNGASYILGRYDRESNLWQIIKVRDCVNTVLAQATPSGTVGGTYIMGFSHRDGKFTIWWKKSGVLSEELSYEWKAADGWMYESETITKKCGIYGVKGAPFFEIVGLDHGGEESEENAEGIPHLPGYSLAGWPDSGEAVIGDNAFSYTSKVIVDPVFGPHQFRNQGIYEAPFGTGDMGLEYLYFDWNRDNAADAGKFVACDNGGCYVIKGSEYQVWITTDGYVVYLHGRSRHYSDNEMIAKNSKYCSHRVYTTGGLAGINMVKGKYKRFSFGTVCHYNVKGDIYCHWYRAASGKAELNVRDLIKQISQYAGASATFPGDIVVSSQTPGAGMDWGVAAPEDTQGMDVRFEIDDLSVSGYVDITADAIIDLETSGSSTQATVRITKTASSAYKAEYITITSGSSAVMDSVSFSLIAPIALQVRVVYHDNFTTLDIGDRWICTFSTGLISYASPCHLFLKTSASMEFRDVLVIELCDWREAIYIDLETDGRSAIGSVIQERPIEMCHKADGSIAYWYDIVRDRITIYKPRQHQERREYPRTGASDAIIQGMYTNAIQFPDFVRRYGFATKVMRMPNLNVGAVRATRITLKKILERAHTHAVWMRPDARIEVGDVILVDFYASGTNKHVVADVIIESTNLSFSASDNNPTLQVSGREELE